MACVNIVEIRQSSLFTVEGETFTNRVSRQSAMSGPVIDVMDRWKSG
jgi:hypothetical protein